MSLAQRYFVAGGAGFIGSHIADALLSDPASVSVTIYDNFSSGREWHYESHCRDPRFRVIRGDLQDLDRLTEAMRGQDVVIHLASNPDIARAVTDPEIDFREGTVLTSHVLEAMRRSQTRMILYASGSGIYGDLGEKEINEDYGPLQPISTYGASKLAGEALISAYCHLFNLRACVFRFGNVVGPRQTHGVALDFLRQLLKDPRKLRILGDGTQSKSYIHIGDVVEAVLVAARHSKPCFAAYNVATGDYITVKEIADIAVDCTGLDRRQVVYEYTGGDRGWKGDVPIVRLNTDRIRRLGWTCRFGSREALRIAIVALLPELQAGRLG